MARRLSSETQEKRNALIQEQIQRGLTSPADILREIRRLPEFRDLAANSAYLYVRDYLNACGIINEKKEFFKKRRHIIAEIIGKGYSGPTKTVEACKTHPEFDGVSSGRIYQLVCIVASTMGLSTSKDRKEVMQRRKEIIDAQIQAGTKSARKIAQSIQSLPEFNGMQLRSVENMVRLHFLDKGIEPPQHKKRSLHEAQPEDVEKKAGMSVRPAAAGNDLRTFDEVIQNPRVRMCLGALPVADFDRLSALLREAWHRQEAVIQSLKDEVARLREQHKEWERHRCPDADGALRGEIERLKKIIYQQSNRIEVFRRQLGYAGTSCRTLSPDHAVINGEKD